MAFLEVDKILEITPNSIKVEKLLTYTDEYFQDHFPRKAVMPGVLMIETFIEGARWLIRKMRGFSPYHITLSSAENVRFGKFLGPGDSLVAELTLLEMKETEARFKGIGYKNGEAAIRGTFKLKISGEASSEVAEFYRKRFYEVFTGSAVSP